MKKAQELSHLRHLKYYAALVKYTETKAMAGYRALRMKFEDFPDMDILQFCLKALEADGYQLRLEEDGIVIEW